MMTAAEYQRYLLSPHWQTTRLRKLEAAGHRCQWAPIAFEHPKHGPIPDYDKQCTATTGLQVHHLHYGTLGAERDDDLEVLCEFHHLVRHAAAPGECEWCGDPIDDIDEDDALEIVTQAVEFHGGDVSKVTLNEIAPDRDSLCWHCRDKLERD
jgi:hypothetical protein